MRAVLIMNVASGTWRHKRQQSKQTWSSPQVAMALSMKSLTGWLARTAPLELSLWAQ